MSSRALLRFVGALGVSRWAAKMAVTHGFTAESAATLKVACFIQGMQTPSSRFRVLQYRAALQEMGIDLVLFPPSIPKGGAPIKGLRGPFHRLAKRTSQLFEYFPGRFFQIARHDLSKFDAILIQKSLMDWPRTSLLEHLIAKRNPRIVFDIDDAEFARLDGGGGPADHTLKEVSKISRVVIAGNRFLADYFMDTPARVEILPTTVDGARFAPASRGDESVCVGWTGTPANFRYLFDLIPVFEVLSRTTNARFRIISDRSHIPELSHIPGMEFVKWDATQEVMQIQAFDIGLMPLHETTWTRGKCAFKLVQYHALGIPSVVSPVGANVEVQLDGETGYFARTPAEWIDKLTHLAGDASLRARLGAHARARFLSEFSLDHNVQRLASLLRSVADA